jgi:uncharacterized protein YhhL (DUF1145 family)
MALGGKNWIQLAWLLDTLVLLAVLLPGLLDHPYPQPFRRYIVWGGLLLYVVSGFCILAFAAKLRNASR